MGILVFSSGALNFQILSSFGFFGIILVFLSPGFSVSSCVKAGQVGV